MMMFHALLALSFFGGAFAQKASIGGCPEVQIVPDFDINKFLGRWYETKRYFGYTEPSARCVTADYCRGENDKITVVNCQLSGVTGEPFTSEGTVRAPNHYEPAKLKVHFTSGSEGDYWILGTDYDNYAVLYSCTMLPLHNFKYAWILTRECRPQQWVIDTAVAIAERNHIDITRFSRTDQNDCDGESWM